MAKLLQKENLTEDDFSSSIQGFFTFFGQALKDLSQTRVSELSLIADLKSGIHVKDDALSKKLKEVIEKNKFLDEENLKYMSQYEDLKNEFEEFKLKNENTNKLVFTIKKLEKEKENLGIRFHNISKYTTEEIDVLLERQEVGCICGSKLFSEMKTLVWEKKKELVNFKPKIDPKKAKNSDRMEGSEGDEEKKEMEEKNKKVVKKLEKEISKLTLKLQKQKIEKKTLDTKLVESDIFQKLLAQVKLVISYSSYLKLRLEKAESNLVEMEKMRAFELNDLQNKENEEKMKLINGTKILQRQLEMSKERQNQLSIELSKSQQQKSFGVHTNGQEKSRSSLKQNDPRANSQAQNQQIPFQPKPKMLLDLEKQVISLTEKLKKERERSKAENHRCYKYEREVLNVKENYYNKLLSKYEDCKSIHMRHSRHTKLFKKLYEFNEKGNFGMKETLDELIKYVKSREEKIAYLERKIKKKEKEIEEEKTQSNSFLDEVTTISSCLMQTQQQNEALKKELKELNENFNKLFKEKNNEIQELSKEIKKIRSQLVTNKNLVQSQKSLLSDIKKKISLQEKMINEETKKNDSQKMLLEKISNDSNETKLKLKNFEVQANLDQNLLKIHEERIQDLSNNLGKIKSDLHGKSNFIENYMKSINKIDFDVKFENVKKEDYLVAQVELNRLRKLLICSLCNKNEKNAIIDVCMHCFCKGCINHLMSKRDRKCPKCMTKIAHVNIKTLYLE